MSLMMMISYCLSHSLRTLVILGNCSQESRPLRRLRPLPPPLRLRGLARRPKIILRHGEIGTLEDFLQHGSLTNLLSAPSSSGRFPTLSLPALLGNRRK